MLLHVQNKLITGNSHYSNPDRAFVAVRPMVMAPIGLELASWSWRHRLMPAIGGT